MSLRCKVPAALLLALALGAQDLADLRQHAGKLINEGQLSTALPLVEQLAAANPDDATVETWLAYCLFAKSRREAAPEEVPALVKRAHEAALRARDLGSTMPVLNDLIRILEDPATLAPPQYAGTPEASARIKEGEQAFGRGDLDGALAAYAAALKLDPKSYQAALFAGDVCFRRKDAACAREWFGKAVAIDPARETAYRYWGDTLVAAGRMLEARDRYIEAVIAEPSANPWNALLRWAAKNGFVLSAPKIEPPQANPNASWAPYATTRAAWHASLFAANFPKETQYRHTLAEEAAALGAVADAGVRATSPPDAQIASLVALKNDGLIEAWIFLSGKPDADVWKDYAAYRAKHHDELRAYIDKYVIHPQPAPTATGPKE